MISIIIPTYNRSKIVNKTIQKTLKVLENKNIEFEIIVVNDGDEEVCVEDNRVKIVKNTKKGVASARNYGVSLSKHDFLLFLDDDMLINDSSVEIITNFINSDKKEKFCLNIDWIYPKTLIELCEKSNFGRYLTKINYISMKGCLNGKYWEPNKEYEIPVLSSAFLVITKSNFNKVGGYDENYPFSGFEDKDFAFRVKNAGINTLLNTTTSIFHNEEDRLDIYDWMKRRYREGVTRAKFVKLNNDNNFIIKHVFFKRIFYELVYLKRNIIIKLTKLLNYKFFDIISFCIFRLLTGAYIWKGYKDEFKKD